MKTELRADIHWVGAIDWNLRDFHGYDTPRGASYNAYLICDEQTVLIDAVKAPFAEELLGNVRELIDPAKIDFVVCNHAETDHAGALPAVMRAAPQAALLCNKRCAATLAEMFPTVAPAWRMKIVEDGETLSIGRRSLQFLHTPMVHWPESMATYLPEEKLLFSMDAFGQHYAHGRRFDDEADPFVLMQEAKTYYANIVVPYAKAVLDCLERLAKLDIEMIAPSHGLVWRSRAAEILAAYRDWASGRLLPKVLVLYDSMWESTAAMARAIVEGALTVQGIDARMLHLRRTTLTEAATEALDAAGMAFGSPTLHRGMMPSAAAALCYLEGLRPPAKAAVAFGSFGWGKGGPEAIDETLRRWGWELIGPPLKSRWQPTPDMLDQCRQIGGKLAQQALLKAK